MSAVKFDLNAYLLDARNLKPEFRKSAMQKYRQVEPIKCADGLEMSVQASWTHYCSPRNSVGPWTEVEVGFPSKPVEELLPYAENPDAPTDTVYACVPVEIVEAVIEKHGGLA